MENKIKQMKLINNIFFYITVGFGIFVIGKTYIERRGLPEGVCPIDNNQSLYFLAIGLLILSFIVNVIVNEKLKKANETSIK